MTLPLDYYDLSTDEIRARFDWARRQRKSSWLWPEVLQTDWQTAALSVQSGAQALIADEKATACLEGEPSAMSLACYTTGMGPLLGWWSQHGRIACTDEISDVLTLHLAHNRLRTGRLAKATNEAISALSERSVPVVVLKGADSGTRYFPDPATRPAADIDLLIDPGDATRAEAALQSLGYRLIKRLPRESDWRLADMTGELRSLMLVHAGNSWSIDLHVSIGIEQASGLPVIPLDRAGPLRTAVKLGDGRGCVLSQPLLLIYLAAHASTGLHNLTLLRLVEIQLVIARDVANAALDWDRLVTVAGQFGALGAIWPALYLSDRLVPGRVPASVLRACAAAVPTGAHKVIANLTPLAAQRFGPPSITEHFMWADGPVEMLRQVAADVVPGRSLSDLVNVYGRRLRRFPGLTGRREPFATGWHPMDRTG